MAPAVEGLGACDYDNRILIKGLPLVEAAVPKLRRGTAVRISGVCGEKSVNCRYGIRVVFISENFRLGTVRRAP